MKLFKPTLTVVSAILVATLLEFYPVTPQETGIPTPKSVTYKTVTDVGRKEFVSLASIPITPFGGACDIWFSKVGISDIQSATYLLNRESHCNPKAINPSSGACGLAQELPCGKSGCTIGDGLCELGWMNKYVADRYGSWANAAAHEAAMSWY